MSSLLDPLLQPIPGNDPNARITTLEAQVKNLLALSGSGDAVGDWKLVRYPPAGWSSGNLIVVNKYAVPNGFNVLKADYPDLNVVAAAAGYPDGSDSTHVTLPDALGRSLVVVGTHSDTLLSMDDALALANRTPKHNSSFSLTSPSGSTPTLNNNVVASSGHTHAENAPTTAESWDGGNATGRWYWYGSGPATGGPSATTTVGISGGGGGGTVTGSVGPGGTRPVDMSSYLIFGILLLRVLP